jgi:uncharacterized protein YndB with AHSA1/START domain
MNAEDDTIVNSRLIDHPRKRVFEAFSDPEQIAKWWGPEGFSNTFETFDFRPGGEWKFVMHGPNGTDYPNESRFVDIVEPERISFDHSGPDFHMIMTFEEEDGKTRLTWNMRFRDPAQSAKIRDFLNQANQQNFDRLEAVLDTPR